MHIRTKGRLAGIAFLVATAFMANAGPAADTAAPASGHATENTRMIAAQGAARNSLETFLSAALDDTGTSRPDTGLKVAFQTAGGVTEVIWVAPFVRDGTGFTGLVANRPMHLKNAPGDLVVFDKGAVRDWFLVGGDGRMYGSFTTRVMLPEMSPEAARTTRDLLSLTPLPASW